MEAINKGRSLEISCTGSSILLKKLKLMLEINDQNRVEENIEDQGSTED